MSLKAVVKYLDYRLKKDEEEILYRKITAEYLGVMGRGMKTETKISFVEERNKIWGGAPVEDNRTAQEVINDTAKKHGINIIKKGGAE